MPGSSTIGRPLRIPQNPTLEVQFWGKMNTMF
jgi:hypothetical protein